jgi:predicted Zn-dependent protease
MKSREHLLIAVVLCCFCPQFGIADAISPNIREQETYSEEAPNQSFYGNGPGSQLTEASALRFEAEQKLREGKLEQALKKVSKAVQFDPGDADGHILLAKILTAQITRSKTIPDQQTLQRAINEWKLIWHHDANQIEQYEARSQARRLIKLSKAIEKQQKLRLAATEKDSL